MLYIEKAAEPQALANARRRLQTTPDSAVNYEGLDGGEKNAILDALLIEQGYVCAYCTKRIHRKGDEDGGGDIAHVEHYLPQHPTNQLRRSMDSNGCYDADAFSLNYRNMLAVCSGGDAEGRSRVRTCDKSRSDNRMLVVNPLDKASVAKVEYKNDGSIFSQDERIYSDLQEQLNLNASEYSFKESRKEVFRSVDRWATTLTGGHRSKCNKCKKKVERLSTRLVQGKKEPFLGAQLWRLNYWIRHWS